MRICKPEAGDISRLKELWKLGFAEPEEGIRAFFDRAFREERCMTARTEEGIAATVYWFDVQYQGWKYAYLFALTTDPAFRGRGIARELMGQVHRYLSEEGYGGALLYPASEGLRSFYRGIGYTDDCTWGEITVRDCHSDRVEITEIGAGDYGILRERFLPERGVIQLGENLDYLATYARFYRGKDCLLAAFREGDTLRGVELLGQSSTAAGILNTLGCERGRFRIPEGDIPGAMFLRLKEGAETPGYFGLPFD